MSNGNADAGSAAEATLPELAEKLSELREHLDQIVARLNDLHNGDRATREAAHVATPGRRFANASTEADGLRCHECGQLSSTDQAGWTLRLCGDDELHPFCPSCDRRHVNGNGRRTPAREPPSAIGPVKHRLALNAEQALR